MISNASKRIEGPEADNRLATAIDTVLSRARHKGPLVSKRGATGMCSIASFELLDELHLAGITDARILRFARHRGNVPDPHPEGDRREEHLTVLAGGYVVDLTRAQFGDASACVAYESIEAAGVDWCEVFDDPEGRVSRPIAISSGGRFEWPCSDRR